MIRVCAWCQAEEKPSYLGVAEPLDDPRETHGVCLDHKAKLLAEIRNRRPLCGATEGK